VRFQKELAELLAEHPQVYVNPSRKAMIQAAADDREAIVSANGALVTWTPPESTGRRPENTMIVRNPVSEGNIDWSSPNNIPLDPQTFEMALGDAFATLKQKTKLYVTDRVVGADSSYAMPVRVVTSRGLTALFTDNMFRPIPQDIETSIYATKGLSLIALPYDKLDAEKYEGRLPKVPRQAPGILVAMDFDRRLGLVYGSAYGGSIKKLVFTLMNYYLPLSGILSLHCSANEGTNGDSALLLGLSGTGKTTLSADPSRALLGDDEHGWSDSGIANYENGCYAKLINLRADKEPEIFRAVFHAAHYLEHGAIIENAMMFPDGTFDLDDERLTPNSRASYPLMFLSNVKPSARSGHAKTILFLTADANGVLPPISKLTPNQAMLWFLMGYTSKLAGTEVGIIDPVSTFSRFFGEPFMPLNPDIYASMLGERMQRHGSQVFLINTGWSGGPFGIGSRMDIDLTRAIVAAALEGELGNVEYVEDATFHVMVPTSCPGVPSEVFFPRNTWSDRDAYDARAKRLAAEFSEHFDEAYGDRGIAPQVVAQCPGK